MSTDAGDAAAPEDTATGDVASERPGLESGDPDPADPPTTTPESTDRGVEGSADPDTDSGSDTGSAADAESADPDTDTDAESTDTDTGSRADDDGAPTPDPASEGFIAGLLRDSTITGLPGETGPSTDDDA